MPQPSPTGPRRHQAPARRTGAAVATVLRGLVSFVVLVVLLTGLPALLWWGTAVIAPSGIQALGHLLSTQDSGQVFILALAVVGWIGWVLFALSVLVEIPAQLRGRTAPQLRLLIGQRTAATLVGTILLALPTGTALASSATPAQAATTATAHPAASAERAPATSPETLHDAEGQRTVTHTVRNVRPAESLWSIAQARLGHGNRWEEIAHLNDGHTMADGQVFHADSPIQPGWTLRLPGEAVLTETAASDSTDMHAQGDRSGRTTDAQGTTHYTVQPGDNLSQIAQAELGDATKYPKIFRLNEGEAQPGGRHFTDPDLIYPGQHLDLPAADAPRHDSDTDNSGTGHRRPGHHDDAHDDQAAPPSATPSTTTPPASATPSASTPEEGGGGRPTASATPSPARPAPSQPSPAATNAPASPTSQPTDRPQANEPATATPPTPTGPDEGSSDTTQKVALAVGIGALLAASLAGALGVKRILQQRQRRAGETIAIDEDPTRLEQVLTASAEPAGVALLDTVLRTLAHHAHAAGRELPTVRGARVTDRTVQLILDDPATELLPPFAAGDVPGTWVRDPESPLLDGDAAGEVPAPYPSLVTLGATEDGALLLANLLHTGALLLDGQADDILAVARALALEAGTCSWSDHTEIITVGLGTRLATLLPKGRVRTMPHLPSVVADLGALLVEAHQRSRGPEDAPEPLHWILICAGDVDAEQAWQLADAVSAARDLPVTVVLPASEATRHAFPDAEQIAAAPDMPIALPHLGGGPVQLQRLTDDQYRQYVHALEVADQPAEPATGTWQLAEDHNLAATAPRPAPHPLLLHNGGEDREADPGNPFPGLASADPSRIRLLKPTPAADHDGASPDEDTAAAEPTDDVPTTPDGHGEPAPLADPPHDDGDDPNAPEVAVLGPLKVTGVTSSGHGPKVAALAALIYLRPGRTAETLCTAMDPASPWSPRTLQSRLSEIRSRFGTAPDGQPYLPRPRTGYVFHPGVRSDWDHFQQLAALGLAAGPSAGIPKLENALGLIRGKPFDGQDYPWADSIQQEMHSRIVDVAHTLATWHAESDTPDLDAARQAALRGLDIDETAEVLYRDWMHIEWAAGNTPGVRRAVARVQQVTRSCDISMEPLTEQTIALVLSDRPTPQHAAQTARS
ncbi:LysM peptidoglycan-binding domain-containing protein [Streptomyces sp. NPDC005408]|uniref:LysM peptidoglycan-binding domain-containing protein n=1 Tax=Streptomyces sp. NPDC005408 TaxID=3155341 RepID=UPI0033A63031